ncbi:hypothetical protein QJS04_geneDACA002665 [Acorus gramineus]|uniref:Reverse transcriptase n=1 Tax=Acorus gramineus TaxID=55184 RepID=A0AAV9ATX1_ACOGR|nr:hypothetical protein QJS04_geneDACA002665 [Acorus gramineus]
MEILSQWLEDALLNNKIGPFTKKSTSVSHIHLSLLRTWSQRVLCRFAAISGLELNESKSKFSVEAGREIQAWHDPWIQGASLTDVLPDHTQHLEQQQGVITHNPLVAGFIQEGLWVKPSWWPMDENGI